MLIWKPVMSVAHSSGKSAKSYKNYFLTSLFVIRKVSNAMSCTILRWTGQWDVIWLPTWTLVLCSLYRSHSGRKGWWWDNSIPKKKYILLCFPSPIQGFGIFPYSLMQSKETTAGLQIWVSSLHEHGLRDDFFNEEKKNGKYFLCWKSHYNLTSSTCTSCP